jgi:hypothetical protein
MQAVFTVLPELPPDNGEPGDDESFDISKQLRIELSVASSDGTGPVYVGVTMETRTGIVPPPPGIDPVGGTAIENALPSTVGAGLEDYWHVKSNQPFTATVRPIIGKGTIRNPLTRVFAGGTYHLTAREVIVHADSNQAMTYSMSGNFRLERSGVRGP